MRHVRKRFENRPIEFPDEIERIRERTPEFADKSDEWIQLIWREFSENHCAGWLMSSEYWIANFHDWVFEGAVK